MPMPSDTLLFEMFTSYLFYGERKILLHRSKPVPIMMVFEAFGKDEVGGYKKMSVLRKGQFWLDLQSQTSTETY